MFSQPRSEQRLSTKILAASRPRWRSAIRILHVISGTGRTGTFKQLTLLCEGLVREGFDVQVCSMTHSDAALDLAGSHLAFTSLNQKWKIDPSLVLRLRQCIRAFEPDIVHTWSFAANTFGRLAALWEGQGHLVAAERSVDEWKQSHQLAIDRFLARRTKRIVANSRGVRDFYVRQRLDADKFRVIPNGIRECQSPPTPRAELLRELRLPKDAKLVGAVGRLRPEKRLKDLIWALDLLRVIRPDVHLLIFGEGPHRWRLERYRDQVQVRDRVHFLGHRHDVTKILPQLECLWQAGSYEGMPNSVMEAMSAGIPVIATDISGNRDLVSDGETGFLVPVGDRAGFARQTNLLLGDRQLAQKLGQRGRDRIRGGFSIERMVEQYVHLYRDIVPN